MKIRTRLAILLMSCFFLNCTSPPQLQKPLIVENNIEMSTQNDKIMVGCPDTIELKKGQRLLLKLPATAGTGFQWQLGKQKTSKLLEYKEKDEIQYEDIKTENQDSLNKVGQNKLQILEFIATNIGSEILSLIYIRPLEPNEIEQTCSITIIVNH